MEISVEGLRTSIADWEAVRSMPKEQLPPLTPEQQQVARKLRILEEDYARSALAGRRTGDRLLARAALFGSLLEQHLRARQGEGSVDRVRLNTWDHRFEIEMTVRGKLIALRVDENLVDDLLDSGSAEADQRLSRILDRVLQVGVVG